MYEKHPLGILGKQNYKWKPLAENRPNTIQHIKKRNENGKDRSYEKAKLASLDKPLYGHHQVKEQEA